MKLSDLVSALTPAMFPIVALIIFFAVFLLITIRTFAPSARAEQRHALGLPLDDGEDHGGES